MSATRPERAHTGRAPIRFPEQLPISARVPDIIEALTMHQVVIVTGATGSGKTTQLPKIALQMGRGGKRRIGVTQPRRIAAMSMATRVADELECELGREVGYKIRFEDRTSRDTWVKFMTDGVLLAELSSDPKLLFYDTLIVDEAHERSLNIDFLLGWLKRILPKRPDLKLVISSATIETERFSGFFGDAPVLEVEGRTYPVEVLYEPPAPELELGEAVAEAVVNVTSLDPRGDILVFLPGEREIRDTEQALGRKELRHTQVLPLYSRLPKKEQARAFAELPGRRVILATNVAETSLTIPGIVYVIDTGLARLSRYDPRTGTTRLLIEAISQASLDQRKGRCGRVREGICIRLFDEQSFAARPAFTDPEMKRTGLAGVILRMKALGLGEVEDFPFLDPPQPQAITEGYRVLEELGALDGERQLLPLGRTLARFPVDPRVARMILGGAEFGCLRELVVLAAGLNIDDPRERPRGQEQKADQLHQRFRVEESDFLGLLKLWDFVSEAAQRGLGQLRRLCKENLLSFSRIREWRDLHQQLNELVRELELSLSKTKDKDGIHLALLSGLLSRVGMYEPSVRNYRGARQTRFLLHPSSALHKKPPAWVMAFELVQTTQLYARTAAKLDPLWLDRVGGHLLKRSYGDPHWSERAGRAMVRERATLFGLPVLEERRVSYASIAPGPARLMFLTHALVRGEYRSRGEFQEHNRQLFDQLARLRDRARQSDMLADDEQLLTFFESRVPESVIDGPTFEAWRARAEQTEPKLLHLTMEQLLAREETLRQKDYPDSLTLRGVTLPLSYVFDPSADDDGITLEIPLVVLPQLTSGELDWTIPAWHGQKLSALVAELPQVYRAKLGSLPELMTEVAARLVPFSEPLVPALARLLFELTGVRVPIDAFRPFAIPPYLHFFCRIVDERGKVLGESRDVDELLQRLGASARALYAALPVSSGVERRVMTTWDFGTLAAAVTHKVHGAQIRAYPALVDRDKGVELALLESEEAALVAHRAGIQRLLLLSTRTVLITLMKRAPAIPCASPRLRASRTETEAQREVLMARLVEEAFGLAELSALPRSRSAFEQLLQAGTPRLTAVFDRVVRALTAIAAEQKRLEHALGTAQRQPSGASVSADVRAELELLLPAELIKEVALPRLEQIPRFLRAAEVRVLRAVVDPQKDAGKAEPFQKVWRRFIEKWSSAQDHLAVQAIFWALEEQRVAVFAPELKPAPLLSLSALAEAIQKLR